MKQFLLFIGATLFVIFGAQAQVSYGLKGGVNLAKFSKAIDGLEDFEKNNLSFYVTGFADLPVAPNFSIQPGLSLQGKGAKYKGEVENISGTVTVNLMSVEVPVNAVYYIPAGPGSVFLGAGPYIGFNLSGKVKNEGGASEDSGSSEEDLTIGSSEDDDIKRIEAGANFMVGYKLNNGFLINAGYGLGLTNLSNSSESEDKISNRVLSFGIGFQF